MGVIKRGNSKNWYIQFQFNGRAYVKSSRTTEKRVAERMEHVWKVQIHSQLILGEKAFIRFSEIMAMYIKTKQGTSNYKCVTSQSRILNRLFPVNKYLHEISNTDIEIFVQHRLREGVKNSTLVHIFNLIRGAWKYGRKMGYQTSDLMFPVLKLPKHRLRYLSLDEEQRLLSELNPRREVYGLPEYSKRSGTMRACMQDNYDLVVLLLDTGARYSEIAGIEWKSIDLKSREIRLWRPKVKNESILYMSDRVYRVLARRHESNNLKHVFASKKGGSRNHATIAIRKAMLRAGLADCTIHTLRHTHATRLIQNGLSIYEVKEILGHTDIATTMRYSHLETRSISSKARDVINCINEEIEKPQLKAIK
jgi:integrase